MKTSVNCQSITSAETRNTIPISESRTALPMSVEKPRPRRFVSLINRLSWSADPMPRCRSTGTWRMWKYACWRIRMTVRSETVMQSAWWTKRTSEPKAPSGTMSRSARAKPRNMSSGTYPARWVRSPMFCCTSGRARYPAR